MPKQGITGMIKKIAVLLVALLAAACGSQAGKPTHAEQGLGQAAPAAAAPDAAAQTPPGDRPVPADPDRQADGRMGPDVELHPVRLDRSLPAGAGAEELDRRLRGPVTVGERQAEGGELLLQPPDADPGFRLSGLRHQGCRIQAGL